MQSFQSFKRFGTAAFLIWAMAVAQTSAAAGASSNSDGANLEDLTAAEPSQYSPAYLPPKPVVTSYHKSTDAAETPYSPAHRPDARHINDAYHPATGPYPYAPAAAGPYPYAPAAGPYPYAQATAGPYPYAPAAAGPYPYAPVAGPYPYSPAAAGPYPYAASGSVTPYSYAPAPAGPLYPYAPAAAGPYPYAPTAGSYPYAPAANPYVPAAGPYSPAVGPQTYGATTPGVTPHPVSHASFSSGLHGSHYSYKR